MKEKNIHEGHRQRMLKKYLEHGIECFEEHEILEILLFLIFSRRNTNDISHMLIEQFGSVKGVLSATRGELTEIENIGGTASTYISFIGDFIRWLPTYRYKKISLNNPDKIIEYCAPIFENSTREMTYILLLDAQHNLIGQARMSTGGPDQTTVSPHDVAKRALQMDCSNIVMVHNHPYGSSVPSVADINATRALYNALRPIGINLVDHIVICPEDEKKGYSMRRMEILKDIWF